MVHQTIVVIFFVGPRGIGKSVMMQTFCLVVGQLLPDVASIYIDASIHHKSPLRHSLVQLLNDRAQGTLPDLSIDFEIGPILSRAEELKCVLALFIDEAHVHIRMILIGLIFWHVLLVFALLFFLAAVTTRWFFV